MILIMHLTQTLYPVGDELIKLVFQKMNGKRITEKISNKLSNLINSVFITKLNRKDQGS